MLLYVLFYVGWGIFHGVDPNASCHQLQEKPAITGWSIGWPDALFTITIAVNYMTLLHLNPTDTL